MSDQADSGSETVEVRRLSVTGLGVAAADRLPQMVVPMIAGFYGIGKAGASPLLILPFLAALALIGPVLRWLRFRYVLSPDELRIEQGFLQRSVRVLPYDRIVDVSIEQPPLARLLGVAVARFDSGGGAGEEAELRYVAVAEAESLRALVRSHAGGRAGEASAGESTDTEETGEPLFTMDLRRLLTQGVYSFSLVVFAVLAAIAGKFDFLLPDGKALVSAAKDALTRGEDRILHLDLGSQLALALAVLAALVTLGLVSGIARSVVTDWGFTLGLRGRVLRRQRGLLTRTDLSVSLPRVQSAIITTGALRRRHGWHGLSLVTLGGDGDGGGAAVVAPFAQLDEIARIAAAAGFERLEPAQLGRPDFRPRRDKLLIVGFVLALVSLVSAVLGGPPLWLSALPFAAYVFKTWFDWQRSAQGTEGDLLYSRAGWWNSAAGLARMINVQTVTISSGPLERRYGLATVSFGIFGASFGFVSVPRAEAEALRRQVMDVAAPIDFSQLNRT